MKRAKAQILPLYLMYFWPNLREVSWKLSSRLTQYIFTLVRFSLDTLAFCGANTACANSIGSFSCPCNTGYENFKANVGCSDINECTHPSWNYYVGWESLHNEEWIIIIPIFSSYCSSNARCVNQEGWTSSSTYVCECKNGYELWRKYYGVLCKTCDHITRTKYLRLRLNDEVS